MFGRHIQRGILGILALAFLVSCGVSGDSSAPAADTADFAGAIAFDLSPLAAYLSERQMVAMEGVLRDKLTARGIAPERTLLQFIHPAQDAVKVPFTEEHNEDLVKANTGRLTEYIVGFIAAACGANAPTTARQTTAAGQSTTAAATGTTTTASSAAEPTTAATTTTIATAGAAAPTAAPSAATAAIASIVISLQTTTTAPLATIPPVPSVNPPLMLVLGKNLNRSDIAGNAFTEFDERNPKKAEVPVGKAILLVARAPFIGEGVVTYHIYSKESTTLYRYVSTVTRMLGENSAFEIAVAARGSVPSRDKDGRILAYVFTFSHTEKIKDHAAFRGPQFIEPPGSKSYAGNLFVYDDNENSIAPAGKDSFQ